MYPDGAIVLRFKEDGLFGPVEAYELHDGAEVVGDAELPAKRAESEDLVRATQEWALPTDRFKLVEANGLVGIRPSASRVLSENSVSVPSGIRTRVAGVKGRYPGPLDDGDDEPSGGRTQDRRVKSPEGSAVKSLGYEPSDPSAGPDGLRQTARSMLRAIADGKPIAATEARALADAVLNADELSRAALAVRDGGEPFAVRRLIELCALLVDCTSDEGSEPGETDAGA